MFENVFIESFNWKRDVPLTKDINFLERFQDKINWHLYFNKFPDMIQLSIIEKFHDNFDLHTIDYISINISLSNEVLENIRLFDKKRIFSRFDILFEGINEKYIDFYAISSNYNLTPDFVNEFSDKLHIPFLIHMRTLTFEVFLKNIDKCLTESGKVKHKIVSFLPFDIEYIKENRNLFKNKDLLEHQKLPTYFIKELLEEKPKLKKEINLARIPSDLDSEYVRELINDKGNRYEYTRYQACRSDEKLISLWDVIDEGVLYEYALVDSKFVQKYKEYIDFNLLFQCLDGISYYINELCENKKLFPEKFENYLKSTDEDEDFEDDFEDDLDFEDDFH